jgi:preprotein translocase subunit SecG
MLQTLLLVIEIIVGVLLVAVVLMQQSEGGALGIGGGPSGFMTARGAGDLLTRTTWILGALFFALAMALTLLAARDRAASSVVDRLKINAINPAATQPAPPAPPAGQTTPQGAPAQPQPAPFQAPTPTVHNPFLGDVPAAPAAAPTAPPSK